MIDSHAHLISDDQEKYPPSPLSGQLDDNAFDDPVTAERLLTLMDEQGVERALAVQRAHLYGFNNAYVCDAAQRYPQRLKSLCMINALDPHARKQVHHWVGERGSVGIRMTEPKKGASPDWFASATALDAWDAVTDLGGSVRLHFYRWNRLDCLAALKTVLTRFPDTTVVVDHLSNIATEETDNDFGIDRPLLDLVEFPNVYLLFSMINLGKLASQERPAASVLRRVVDEFGAARVMWGSDVAQSKGSYEKMVTLAYEAVSDLSTAEKKQVLDLTARRVYWSE
jgi:predicted TIM-barrel fold metal-dependent hydrolase